MKLPDGSLPLDAEQHPSPSGETMHLVSTPVTQDEEAREHVRRLVAASRTSFFWAIRLLSRLQREAMFAIYAYCREIDDIADDPLPREKKAAALAEWRREIERVFARCPRSLTGRALVGPVATYALEKKDFLALIDGMEMDALGTMRGPTMAELELYCARVACAVGLLSVRVFGESGENGRRVAWTLGQALQLTNILRDMAEDATRGRLYLPAELLDRHGISSRSPAEVLSDPALPAVCDELADLAAGYFAQAAEAISACPRRHMRPAVVMMEVYRRILERLRARGWRRFEEPVRVPSATKIWIAVRHGLL